MPTARRLPPQRPARRSWRGSWAGAASGRPARPRRWMRARSTRAGAANSHAQTWWWSWGGGVPSGGCAAAGLRRHRLGVFCGHMAFIGSFRRVVPKRLSRLQHHGTGAECSGCQGVGHPNENQLAGRWRRPAARQRSSITIARKLTPAAWPTRCEYATVTSTGARPDSARICTRRAGT